MIGREDVVDALSDEALVVVGNEARRFRDSAAYARALKTAEAQVYGEWVRADTPEQREKCHAVVHALHEFERALESVINDGLVAEATLRERQ